MAPMTKSDGSLSASHVGRVAVIAGSGRLPEEIAASLAKSGKRPFVVVAEGEVDPASPLFLHDHAVLKLEEFGELVPLLKRKHVAQAVMAGGIARRPHWRALRLTLNLLSFLPKAIAALAKGDDALLRAIVGHIEANGIKVVGAQDIVPDLLAPEGCLTKAKPQVRDRRDMDAAYTAARAIGALDIGQAAIAIGGRAVALEGVEGTDGLLERVKDLRANGRIAVNKGGVLVKCAKPGQELRADLPTIGPMTVDAAQAAGLAGVAVESGRSFIMDYAETIRRADELGLFVFGLPQEGD